jgi:hypothetical protein
VKKFILILPFLVACGSDHITLETQLWHSELCHPEIYYVGQPPNAVRECKWTAVYPPGHGYQIR